MSHLASLCFCRCDSILFRVEFSRPRGRGLLSFLRSILSFLGVVKRIIPAVASTNAVIAAACASEVFKIVSSTANSLSNYVVFNDVDGVYTHTFEAEKKTDCLACSQSRHALNFSETAKLQEVKWPFDKYGAES